MSASESTVEPAFGERVDGIDTPVFNERAVRAAAGVLVLPGLLAFMTAALTNDFDPLRAFGMVFLLDMTMRLFVSTRLAPSLALGALIVRRQRPEWVGAAQKKLTWQLGLGMAAASCVLTGWFGIEGVLLLWLCGVCISLLFLETAFGICLGCSLYRILAKEKPHLCPGDTCTYTPAVRPRR